MVALPIEDVTKPSDQQGQHWGDIAAGAASARIMLLDIILVTVFGQQARYVTL